MSFLDQKFKYFAEIESESITLGSMIWRERSRTRNGEFTFEVWDPSSAVAAKLVPTKVFEFWAGWVNKASWDSAVKGDLTKLTGILKMPRKKRIAGRDLWIVEGVDRSAVAHNSIINASYTAQRPDQIVTSAWTTAAAVTGGPSGITFNNVATADFTSDLYKSPYKTLWQVMEDMADATGWVWYIDSDFDLNFKPASDDYYGQITDSADIAFGTTEFLDDASELANKVWVFGGVTTSDTQTVTFSADGTQYTWALPHAPNYSSVTVTKGGVAQTVGRDGKDDFTAADVLVNPEGQAIRFDSSSPPSNGNLIVVTYDYDSQVITRREDSASISAYGLHEHVIVDAEIQDNAIAAERARAHLREYAYPGKRGEFEVFSFGPRAGQSVHVVHTEASIDAVYTVEEVDREIRGPEWAVVTVKVRASPKEVGLDAKILQLDQRVTRLETKDIPDDAPVNTFQDIQDEFGISDSISTTVAAPESRVGHALVGYSEVG